ncbi:MAG: riboflavin kinase, partial [Planctomycetota bacterium]
IRAARDAVGDRGKVVALCLDPHPLSVLRPSATPSRLSTFEQRAEWLACGDGHPGAAAGADEVIALRPSPELLGQTPQEFIASVAEAHAPAVIVEGPDFRFGRDRAGSPETLCQLETRHGYRTIIIDAVEVALADHHVVRVTSSLIRWLVARGRVRDAALLLGRPHEIVAQVAPGDGRGHDLGVPTVNLGGVDLLLPADGVYSGFAVRPDGQMFPAAISVGHKPTFGRGPRVCEAHLIGYEGPSEDYGWALRLRFHDWLRDQIAYADVGRLVEQMRRDVEQVEAMCTMGSPT